jgi:hypothetical protein
VENTNPEQPIEVKGEPITFMASVNNDGATRANVAGTLEGFTLWGVQNNAVSTTETGLPYEYDGDLEAWVNADAPTYDTGDNPVPYYFYAMALGNTPIASNADGYNARNNAAKANAITFENGSSTTTKGSVLINGNDTEETPLLLTGGNFDAKSFTYTMPTQAAPNTNYLDLDKQEDLLVAHNFGTENAGWTTGAVPLQFEHAFSNIELNIAFQVKEWFTYSKNYDWIDGMEPGWFAVIKSFTIHGLKKTGTYTFGTGWSHPDGTGEIKFVFPTGLFIFGASYETPNDDEIVSKYDTNEDNIRRNYEKTLYTPIARGESSVMVIPQEYTPWALGNIENADDECYILVEGEVVKDEISGLLDDWTDQNKEYVIELVRGWALFGGEEEFSLSNSNADLTPKTYISNADPTLHSYYLPFKIANGTKNTLYPNKRYPFYIDLRNLRNDLGEGAIEGINL